jgi:hypothetical protein
MGIGRGADSAGGFAFLGELLPQKNKKNAEIQETRGNRERRERQLGFACFAYCAVEKVFLGEDLILKSP